MRERYKSEAKNKKKTRSLFSRVKKNNKQVWLVRTETTSELSEVEGAEVEGSGLR